jgi:hypothetical protein
MGFLEFSINKVAVFYSNGNYLLKNTVEKALKNVKILRGYNFQI